MLSEEVYLKIVRAAIKAPSGHNTQPWLFSKTGDGIFITPDFSRALPVADSGNRELYISLGCAAETAMIAARFYGYKPVLQINTGNNPCFVEISLKKDETAEQPELFSYISARQTARNLYDNKAVPEEDLTSLEKAVSEPEVGVRIFSGQTGLNRLAPYIAEANAVQMNNPKFKNELTHWMRFSEKEAMVKGDGLYTASSGVPSMGRLIGSFVLKNLVTAKSEEKRLLTQLKKSAVVVLFTTQCNDAEQWIKTGMAFQQFALTATKLGLSLSYLNSPCQIPQVRDKMISDSVLDGTYPQLLIRLGYSKKMPYSFRRRINSFTCHQPG